MIIFATLSKPTTDAERILSRKYERVKIRLNPGFSGGEAPREGKPYLAEFLTATQAFHKNLSAREAEDFLRDNIGRTFRNCTERTESEEIVFMTSRKGKVTRVAKPLKNTRPPAATAPKMLEGRVALGASGQNRVKNYIIQEGERVPFLQELGVMTSEGKVVASKHAKFRQINRFLELLDDVMPDTLKSKQKEMGGVHTEDKDIPEDSARFSQAEHEPIRILDFGSGKSYLTFAVHYYLSHKNIPFEITGIDLKKDVIENCEGLSRRLDLRNIRFFCGDIADFSAEESPDIVITLHACDTATDLALAYAVRRGAKAILSVPCCQHEINSQLRKNPPGQSVFRPLLKYGIVRERFAALVTDCARAEVLERAGYSVQILEFIDMEGTPKNLLIRAVLKDAPQATAARAENPASCDELLAALGAEQTLRRMLRREK